MRKLLLLVTFFVQSALLAQETGSIRGTISDGQTNEALSNASVTLKGSSISSITDGEGVFRLTNIRAGQAVLVISHVGYQTFELPVRVAASQMVNVHATLMLNSRMGNEIVISASRRPESIIHAPASIQVIGTKELNQFAGSNVGELFSTVQGMEYTRSGVDDITFNARGFHSAFNIKVFQLVDGRSSMAAASGSLPVFNNGSTQKDDIDRIEVIMGPQTALYGPNAHNILFNYITKDPRKYPGTTVSVSAGSQRQFSTRLRHAASINNKWAYKITGEHATGEDYHWFDTVYAGGNAGPVLNAFGKPVAIPERIQDFTFRRYRGEGHVYYNITPKATLIVSGGGSRFTRLQVTTSGRNQMRDMRYGFLQAKYVHPRFFASIYNTWGNLGKSLNITNYTRDYWNRTHGTGGFYMPPEAAEIYATRLGNRFNEASQRLNAEMQYNDTLQRARIIWAVGFNYQLEKPNGHGISLVDSFERIKITQYGAVVQAEKMLPWQLRLVAATRFDNHSNFGNFIAPKFALIKSLGESAFRVTWGKAYSMPSILNQYAGINQYLFGNGGGIKYIPNGSRISDLASIKYTTPLKSEEVSSWEVGFRGHLFKKLFADFTYYNALNKNFISPTIAVPGRVLEVNGIPVVHNINFAGVDKNDTLRNATFLTFFNYGAVRTQGIDVGLHYNFNKFIHMAVKYSWFHSDITKNDLKNDANKDSALTADELSLNAPVNRGVVMIDLQNLYKQKLFVSLACRYVQQYDFYSGNQIGTAAGKGKRGFIEVPNKQRILKNFDWGPLGGFATIDVSLGFKFNNRSRLNIGVTNLLNTRQIEFVGSPSIGRLIMAEFKIHLPNNMN